jgi:hypothetical protein
MTKRIPHALGDPVIAKLFDEAAQLMKRPGAFPTEEGRVLYAMHMRLLEVLIFGEARTPIPGGHHI